MIKKTVGWNVTLSMPKLVSPKIFVEGQRATRGGMWFCKGRMDERDYVIETREFISQDSEIGRRLTDQVTRARSELLRIQDIYLLLGKDPDLHNANYSLEFSFTYDSSKRLMDVYTYGWRTKKHYQGHSVLSVFRQYRIDLEHKFADQLGCLTSLG